MLDREYIPKDFVLYVVNFYGNMLTWDKETVVEEIKAEIEKAKGKKIEEKRGRWIHDNHYITCTLCNMCYDERDSVGGSNPDFYFCPNCGARNA